MAPKRFVSWVAVSSRPQLDGGSPTDQRERNLTHMAKWDGCLVADLEVPGQSRSYIEYEEAKRQIEAYRELDALIKANAFDVLICYNVGRLGRKRSLITTIIDLCYEAGILVYRTSSPPNTLEWSTKGYSELLIEAIESCSFQNEVDQTKEHHRTGMIRRIERGEMPGIVPYGWNITYTGRKTYTLSIDEQAAQAIRLACELYTQGLGNAAIAAKLNETGHTFYARRRKDSSERIAIPFAISSVRDIFSRIWVYAGYAQVNQQSTKREFRREKSSIIPPIIDEATLQKVVAELALRKRANPPKGHHLYSGIVVCTTCNNRMSVITTGSPRRRKDGSLYYLPTVRCHKCTRQVSWAQIERAILQWFDAIDDQEMEVIEVDNSEAIEQERQTLQKQLDGLPGAQERAFSAFVDGDVDKATYQAQVKRLEARKRELQDKLQAVDLQLAKHRRSDEQIKRWVTVKEVGREMIALGRDRPAEVNAWLREYIRVEFDENRKLTIKLS